MMKNKKGWLRIVEAFIAVLIIASVLIVLALRVPKQDTGESIHELQRHILTQISSDNSLRGEILDPAEEKTNTKNFIEENLPNYWNFTMLVCEVDEVCGMPLYVKKEIYADEILITSTLQDYNPKKLKLFVWGK